MTTVAIFSDIHGNEQALQAILEDIKTRNIDKIYCLGDVIGIGPSPRECLDLIMDNSVEMVLGNHELYCLKGSEIDDELSKIEIAHINWLKDQLNEKYRGFLEKCKMKITKNIGRYIVSFQHFLLNSNVYDIYPFDDLSILGDESINSKISKLDLDITFIGHEHKAFELGGENRRLIDVGSSGCVKDEYTHYTILSIEDDELKIEQVQVVYDRKKFEQVFNRREYPCRDKAGELFFGIKKQMNIK